MMIHYFTPFVIIYKHMFVCVRRCIHTRKTNKFWRKAWVVTWYNGVYLVCYNKNGVEEYMYVYTHKLHLHIEVKVNWMEWGKNENMGFQLGYILKLLLVLTSKSPRYWWMRICQRNCPRRSIFQRMANRHRWSSYICGFL